jgi:broad specificity phosphatase PhoE
MRLRSLIGTTSAAILAASFSPSAAWVPAGFWSNNNEIASGGKVVTFLRHGCTYMNEYLGGADGGKRFGSPNFTDVFTFEEQKSKYHDTPLSPLGYRQAMSLQSQRCPAFVAECELIVVSPLTRALQTFDVGLKGHWKNDATASTVEKKLSPIVAHPDAAERLYLVSDRGRSVAQLQSEFPYVDFETCFYDRNKEDWWYQPTQLADGGNEATKEWRPIGNGQRYACPSEPTIDFDLRMSRFLTWLQERPEGHILVVCHHGVIDWMLDADFANCQYRSVRFDTIQPRRWIKASTAVGLRQ